MVNYIMATPPPLSEDGVDSLGVRGLYIQQVFSQLHKWNLTLSRDLKWCMNKEENFIHVLRDCLYATHVWTILIPSNKMTHFCSVL